MNSFGVDICEVCGTRAADHAGWFAVAGTGLKLEVLPWSDAVRGRSDCRHACCSEHVEQLVFSAATHDLCTLPFALETHRGGWNPDALRPSPITDEAQSIGEDSLLQILSVVDSILGISTEDSEDDITLPFDA